MSRSKRLLNIGPVRPESREPREWSGPIALKHIHLFTECPASKGFDPTSFDLEQVYGPEWEEKLSRLNLESTLCSVRSAPGWRLEPRSLETSALILHRLRRYSESEPLLEQLYALAQSDEERFSVLMSLAVGYFRQGLYVRAYVLSLRSMKLEPSAVEPWLVAAASVGRTGEVSLLSRFVAVFGRSFQNFRHFPGVVSALMTHPDLESFTCSEPYLEELEDRVCAAAEWLQGHDRRKTPSNRILQMNGPHPASQLLLHFDEPFAGDGTACAPGTEALTADVGARPNAQKSTMN